MVRKSIIRFFLCLVVTAQLPHSILVAQPKSGDNKPAMVANQKHQDSEKKEEDSSLWSNPLVKIGALVAVLYAGGAVVATSIYYQIKDLLPVDKSSDNKDEDDCDE